MANSESGKKPQPVPTCTCGIEIHEANRLCTERDCPYKR